MLPPYYVPSSDSLRHKTAQFVCSFDLHLHGSVGVGIQSEARAVVSQHGGQSLYIYSVLECQCCEGMPLRYNNDKQKKPLFSRGLSVCRLLFNSFSKLKIDENYKEKRRLFY